MSKPILMPQVGQDLTEGKLVEWRVKLGDKVAKGDIVAVVESEKASFEVEAFEAGTVLDLLFKEGDTTEVLAPIMFVGDPAEKSAAAPAAKPEAATAAPASNGAAPAVNGSIAPAPAPAPSQPEVKTGGVPRSSPLARRLAKQGGLDLASLVGSGPRGAVVRRDIDKALQANPQASASQTPAGNSAAPSQALRSPEAAPQAVSAAASGPAKINRAWLRKGEGDPIVFIHGFGADLNSWRGLVGSGAWGRPILAVDLPGHGQSTGLDRVTLAGLAEAVAKALAEEGVSAADLVGHSLGAAVAVALAETARFTVRSLFLIAPAGLGPDINGAFLEGFGRARSAESLAPWMSLLVSDGSLIGPALVNVTADTRAAPGVAAAQDHVAASVFPDGTQAFSIRAALSALPCPVRVVVGTEDRIIPARHTAGLPGTVALHVFAGLGHMPHLEAREPVARLLAEHLRSAA